MKYLVYLIVFIVLSCLLILVPRLYKDIVKKQNTINTYAIQNVKTGKDIRVYNAGIDDGQKIILYSHHNWECMTWQFIQLEENTYLLKNLYTQKTFQPSASPEQGATLWQQTMGGDRLQYWEFIKQSDEIYQIRLKGTELYITRLYLIDTIYRIFLEAGLPPEEVQMVSASINNYVLCFVMDEMKLLNVATGQGITVNELTSHGNEMLKNLPEDQYPNDVFMSEFISRVDKDREFQYSLEIIIDGIKNRIASLKSI